MAVIAVKYGHGRSFGDVCGSGYRVRCGYTAAPRWRFGCLPLRLRLSAGGAAVAVYVGFGYLYDAGYACGWLRLAAVAVSGTVLVTL